MDWSEFWKNFADTCINIAGRLLFAGVTLAVGILIIKLVMKLMTKGTPKHPLDTTAKQFLCSLVKYTLRTILIIMVIGILGVPLASVIAVLASAGVAVALALQGSLSNIASGVLLLFSRPLNIGDYVEIGSTAGTVTDIGLVYTKLKTPDNRHVNIPNSGVTAATIINYSREAIRRVDIDFNIAYGSDVETVKRVIRKITDAHDKVLGDPEPFIRVTALSDSAQVVTVRVWCAKDDFFDVKFDMTEQIKTALDASGVQIPFPQVDVHIKEK